jgi:2-C-methyl-D-erythritol 4-phosphate cytidylyltransferase
VGNSSLALIIPAAGYGARLGSEVPKPYLEIAGKTILEHTLSRFKTISGLFEVVVSTSPQYVDKTRQILQMLFEGLKTTVVMGGAERQHSIKNALDSLSEDVEFVAVHDAVRPFIEPEFIQKCFDEAQKAGGAIIAVPAKDTIKISDGLQQIVRTPDRKNLWQAQTPQIFKTDLLKQAYTKAERENFLGTDDASLLEYLGEKVLLVEGNRENFKITYPLDLRFAEWLLNSELKKDMR